MNRSYNKWNNLLFLIISVLTVLITPACNKQILIENNPIKKIVIYATDGTFIQNGRTGIINKYKEITGIDLVIDSHFTPDQLNEVISGTDWPDVIQVPPASYLRMVNAGILVDLTEWINQSMVLKKIDPQYINHYKLTNGRIYAVPFYKGKGCVNYTRKDWLDQLGIKEANNWNEFVDNLKAFTFNDPDNNHRHDTYGYTLALNLDDPDIDIYNRMIFFDARMNFIQKEGKWIDGFADISMAEALERLRTLYADQLIDHNLFNNTINTAREKFVEGDAGNFEYWADEAYFALHQDILKKNPNATLIVTPPIEEASYFTQNPGIFGITVNAKNPKAIFEAFIEGLFDQGPIQTLFTYGIEGVHWTKNNNRFEFLNLTTKPFAGILKILIPVYAQFGADLGLLNIDSSFQDTEMIIDRYSKLTDLPVSNELYLKNFSAITVLKQTIMSHIVKGNYAVSEGLDVYQKKVKEYQLDEILAELNR